MLGSTVEGKRSTSVLGVSRLGGSQGALRLRKASLGSPPCFNISAHKLFPPLPQHVGGQRSQVPDQARESACRTWQEGLRSRPALDVMVFQRGRQLLGVPGAMRDGGWMLSLPADLRHPQPCLWDGWMCFWGVHEEVQSGHGGYKRVPKGLQGPPLLCPERDADAEQGGVEHRAGSMAPGRGWLLNKASFRLRWGPGGGQGWWAMCICREGTGIH